MSVGTIVQLDPKLLRMAPNVRKDTKLTKEFLASIKEFGVETPVVVVEREDGFDVVDGQRRTLAAIDVGLQSVDCYVSAPKDDVRRIESQIVANEHREELERGEVVAAVQELALFDMKAPAIAKKLNLDTRMVEKAVKIGSSPAALSLWEEHGWMDAAAIVAEFEGDPEQKKLLEMAKEGDVWRIEQHGKSIMEDRRRAELNAEIEATQGVTLIAEPSGYGDPQPLNHLYQDAGFEVSLDGLDHAVVVDLAGDGLVAWPDHIWDNGNRGIGIMYGIRGWKARGLFVRPYYETERSSTPKPATPEEAEALKAERRAARENTKQWVAVTGLRIAWLQQLVQRKTMPKGWEPVVAARMLYNAGSYSTSQLKMMTTILQVDSKDAVSIRNGIEKLLTSNPTRAAQIMLAIDLGSVEGGSDFDKKGWNGGSYHTSLAATRSYLKRLGEWGYELSGFEKLVIAGKTPKAVQA